jgi:GT2 family glycosyltransferase
MVGGRVVNALPENNYAAASQLLVDFLYERYNADPLQAQFFTANNLALRRDLFLELGGFDTCFSLAAGEDRELCHRWINRGYRMFYEPAALVHHAHDLTLAGFWRQHVNYGRGAFRFRQQQNERLKLERPTFYADLLRYPFRRANGPQAAHLFIRFLLMQVANTYGFIREKWDSTAS